MTQPLPTHEQIDLCLLSHRHPLRKRLQGLQQRLAEAKPLASGVAGLWEQIQRSQQQVAAREAQTPQISYPPELPISEKRQDIAALIERHQVVVLCGETGSGKSTQLPKICLDLGRGRFGRIGHTQPRRIAARSLASRIAEELGQSLGTGVGYKVRFHDQVRPETQIKLVTDGMLLAEIQQDRYLNEYDTLIIDEAHERSLNIDFLLGYLQQLLPKRPDLKLIITSATIDPERFSRHFRQAPIINVSGRTYPVELRYRPPLRQEDAPDSADTTPAVQERFSERDEEMQQAILNAVDELSLIDRGDILIFLSGEREIRETAESLRKHRLQMTEVLPLYARLSVTEQTRIFHPGAQRRIVLATNVAETSLTVPGIRYVIDTGYARISRYSHRSKVQRLPVEHISQASANQRKGRCGRLAEGVCIRLYSEEDYNARSEFTEAEILRTNLASVILQMKLLGFGEIGRFPFVDPPDARLIKDGYRVLEEIGAVDGVRKVTRLGRQLAKLPVDPRIGRMLLEAAHSHCQRELLIIAAALSLPDPRDRPHDKPQAADEAHREFTHETSDFLSYVLLWDHLEEQRRHLSKRRFRDYCKKRFLSWVRVQEWHDIHQQLRGQLHEMGYTRDQSDPQPSAAGGPSPEQQRHQLDQLSPLIHHAILSGLLSHIGFKASGKERDYQGARNSRFFLFPGSGQFKRQPKWVVAAELVETTKLYARNVAQVQPEWIESMAGHLINRSYSEPHWEKKRGQVAAYEKVSLFGLVLVARRKINFGPLDPAQSREIFLRSALVEGDFHSRAPFWRHNLELIDSIRDLEARERRRDLLVDEEQLYNFYANRVPEGIYSSAQFEQWLKKTTKHHPKQLHMRMEDLLKPQLLSAAHLYPDSLDINGMQLPLEYRFDPAHQADGVTLRVPRAVLNQVTEERCQWLVPGLLRERIIALLRGLPKNLRKHLVPIPATADRCLKTLTPSDHPLIRSLGEQLKALTGVHIPEEAWDETSLSDHLRMNLEILDDQGQPIARGRDLAALKRQQGVKGEEAYHRLPAAGIEREGIRQWDFGDLPEYIELAATKGLTMRGYPALIDQGDSLAIRVVDSRPNAERATRAGLRRLIQLSLPQEMRYLRKNLPGLPAMRLQYAKAPPPPLGLDAPPHPDVENELVALIVDLSFLAGQPLPRQATAFQHCLNAGKAGLMTQAHQTLELVRNILEPYQRLRKTLTECNKINWLRSISDIQQQLDRLVFQGFLQQIPYSRLEHYPRYLKGIAMRLDKLQLAPARDQQQLSSLQPLVEQWESYDQRLRKDHRSDERIDEIRWMLEELRISLFAQQLGTAYPISPQRLERRWKELGL